MFFTKTFWTSLTPYVYLTTSRWRAPHDSKARQWDLTNPAVTPHSCFLTRGCVLSIHTISCRACSRKGGIQLAGQVNAIPSKGKSKNVQPKGKEEKAEKPCLKAATLRLH